MAHSRTVHGQAAMFEDDRPKYNVPSMAEVASLTGTNGFTALSTFSGCGGSSLGLKMAGFSVPVAVEFIPEAAATYQANAPETLVIDKNIRDLDAVDLLRAAGMNVGDEVDLLEGSPPCASFSTAGRREAHWGKEKEYSDTKERVDDLFDEFIRLVGEIKPKVFVAENVTGLAKGVAVGYLKRIMQGLADQGYQLQVKTLDAQWLGVPQRRKRLIFLGVRNDLGLSPALGYPKPFPYRYTVEDALLGLENAPVEPETDMTRYEVGKEWQNLRFGQQSDRFFSLIRVHPFEPCPTITQTGGVTSAAAVSHPYECRKFSVAEAKRLCGFPDDFILTGTYRQQYERLGRAVPPLMYKAVGEAIRDNILAAL